MTAAVTAIDVRAIDRIRPTLSRDEAEGIVRRLAPDYCVASCEPIYYPYDWSRWRLTARCWVGSRTVAAHCMVDAIAGRAATTDRVEIEATTVPASQCLSAERGDRELLEAARDYAVHAFIQAQRIRAVPECELIERLSIFRPFWVVSSQAPGAERLRLLVDATTGRFEIIGN